MDVSEGVVPLDLKARALLEGAILPDAARVVQPDLGQSAN